MEQVILGHPAVAQCAVIGVPADVEAGEDEVLAVVVASGDVDAAAIWAWCQGRMPGFAIPRFIRFAAELPRTPSEKIQKGELRGEGIKGAHDRMADAAGERL